MVQRFLYCHPFYNWFEEKCITMQILVVGDSEYAVRFVDLSLQTGQMIDRKPIMILMIKLWSSPLPKPQFYCTSCV